MGYLSEYDIEILKNRLCPGEEPTVPTEDEIYEIWGYYVMSNDPPYFLMEGLLFFNEQSNRGKGTSELGLFLQDLDIGSQEPSTNEFRPNQFSYLTESGQNFVRNQKTRRLFDLESARSLVHLLFKLRHHDILNRGRICTAVRNWIIAIRTYYPNMAKCHEFIVSE